MRRTSVRPTDGLAVGVAIFSILLILLRIWKPEIYPGFGNATNGETRWGEILLATYVVVFILSLFIGVNTAAAFRNLSTEQRVMGFAPMIFCFISLLVFYLLQAEQVQQHLQQTSRSAIESRQEKR